MTKKELFKKALSKLPEAENKAHFDFLVDYFNLKEIDQILTETFPEKIRLDIVKEVNFINRYSDYADAELRADDLKLLSEIIREIRGYFKEAVKFKFLCYNHTMYRIYSHYLIFFKFFLIITVRNRILIIFNLLKSQYIKGMI